MKPKTAYGDGANLGFAPLLLLTTIYFCMGSASVFASGIKDDKEQNAARPELKTLLRIEPAERPEWVPVIPQSETEFYFVGTSQPYDTAANARNDARENARVQVLEYYGQVIESQAVSLSSVAGSTRDTLASYLVHEDEIKSFAQNVVSEVATRAYYTEVWLDSSNKEEYIVHSLHQINRQKAEEEIANFAKNISERYTASLSQWNTLKAALEGYAFIAKSLEQNPLHRIMAYLETSAGKAGLYEYARLRINELANSVSIEPIPARTIQETESLHTSIRLKSSIMPSTGLLECQAKLFGTGDDNIVLPFSTASDDPFNLENKPLPQGSYNVQVEILLSALTGGIAKNSGGGFSFVVTPLNELLDTPAAIEAGIKKAVDALALNLQTQTETIIGTFNMAGTGVPSELSVFLAEKVDHYAKNNQGRKYRIVEDSKQAAVFSGFFTRRNDKVDVTFQLAAPDKGRDGSQIFSLSVATLVNTIGIAIEPENINSMIALDDVVPVPARETIHIEARFNSSTRAYKHRDELKLALSADRDCYFKIIHIDADNKIKMIFPARGDNNFLRANESRAVFDSPSSRYVFYGPYGAETLVVVASPVQFPRIENEYGQPWKAASEEAIRAALAGAGEARYPITIIKPHEEYEYAKPENMTEMYQAIRGDAERQGGYFEGGAASGFYIINNVRGSYRVTGDKIQFASYNLDAYTAENYRGGRARGAAFNFSFAKPQNINQAVQQVRRSILESGGTFAGNEQQGNFKGSGIAGQYKVGDMVEVSITEKPFVVPNALIKKEVENYFGVR